MCEASDCFLCRFSYAPQRPKSDPEERRLRDQFDYHEQQKCPLLKRLVCPLECVYRGKLLSFAGPKALRHHLKTKVHLATVARLGLSQQELPRLPVPVEEAYDPRLVHGNPLHKGLKKRRQSLEHEHVAMMLPNNNDNNNNNNNDNDSNDNDRDDDHDHDADDNDNDNNNANQQDLTGLGSLAAATEALQRPSLATVAAPPVGPKVQRPLLLGDVQPRLLESPGSAAPPKESRRMKVKRLAKGAAASVGEELGDDDDDFQEGNDARSNVYKKPRKRKEATEQKPPIEAAKTEAEAMPACEPNNDNANMAGSQFPRTRLERASLLAQLIQCAQAQLDATGKPRFDCEMTV